MYVITYSLDGDTTNSLEYYKDVSTLTDNVVSEGIYLFEDTIGAFYEFVQQKIDLELTTNSYVRSKEEALLELLILGVLWRVYSGDSKELDELPKELLVKLSEIRKENEHLKPGVDLVRGVFSTLFLSPDLFDNLSIAELNLSNLDLLLGWLSATNEFNHELKKLREWQEYLNALQKGEAINIISAAVSFALWFETTSEKALALYTENVDRYLNEIRPKRYWREDVIFCGRRRVEYHLNMVGAEIMNRSFKKKFLAVDNKMLLIPTCMRLLGSEKCKAQKADQWLECVQCTKECQVAELTDLGNELDFKVYMVAHGSSISAGKNSQIQFNKNVGVIGVSCVLNLISGGWLLEEMGIPAQCVLLDYCGCKNHWHDHGIPTRISVDKLRELVKGK